LLKARNDHVPKELERVENIPLLDGTDVVEPPTREDEMLGWEDVLAPAIEDKEVHSDEDTV